MKKNDVRNGFTWTKESEQGVLSFMNCHRHGSRKGGHTNELNDDDKVRIAGLVDLMERYIDYDNKQRTTYQHYNHQHQQQQHYNHQRRTTYQHYNHQHQQQQHYNH